MNDFEIGDVVDEQYEIIGLLGSGGMGRVYQARQLNLDRMVAIKVPSETVRANADYMERFEREARLCAKVSHSHVVAIHDVRAKPVPYIVMEYVDGMPLQEFLKEESTTVFVSDLLEIIQQICQGLQAAHAQGVIHRDIKPSNIVIANDTQQVKIMDFGIARASGGASLTIEGAMLGTPFYMSPEQIQGRSVTPAADLYGLACVVYRLFAGGNVFDGEISTVIYKHMSEPSPAPTRRNPMLPASVDRVFERALAKKASDRYGSAMEFQRELRKSLRSLAHLPYSQIFPRSSAMAPSAMLAQANEPTPPNNSKTLPSAKEIAPPEFAPTAALAPAAPAEPPPKPGFRWARNLTVFALMTVVAAATIVIALFPQEVFERIQSWTAPLALAPPPTTPGPTPSPAVAETPSSSAPIRLFWLGREPAARYASDAYLTARWRAEPKESRVWRVEMIALASGLSVASKRTRHEQFILGLQAAAPGRYRLIVRPDDGGPGTLEKEFVIGDE